MNGITNDELKEILGRHVLWLNGDPDGVRADLSGANLSGADLRGADLYRANLREANLSWANLYWANLYRADLYRANLCWANLHRADLYGADLCEANLRRADLYRANLRGADLYRANLRGADLYGADLCETKNVPFIPMACPESGSYTAYKRASKTGDACTKYIVVLEISSDAIRSSATTRKCRANKAKVIRIENLDGSIPDGISECRSEYNPSFIYKIGETVEVKNFDMDRWNECAPGIHHFISRQEAVEY